VPQLCHNCAHFPRPRRILDPATTPRLCAAHSTWLTSKHPDPLGDQLVNLAAAIERAELMGMHGNPPLQVFPKDAP
jgi:hypothetical protein